MNKMKEKMLIIAILIISNTYLFANEKNDLTLKNKEYPTAEFSFAITGRAPATVQFLNQSKNAESYSWDFGDGTTSKEKNPIHIYKEGGPFIVTLKIEGNNKSDKIQSIVKIKEKPKQVRITKIILKEMPLLRPSGEAWDRDGGVELFLKIIDTESNGFGIIKETGLIAKDMNLNSKQAVIASFNNLNLSVKDDFYFIQYLEYDEWSDNEFIGYVSINFNEYAIEGKLQYPLQIEQDQNGIKIVMELEWL